MVFLKGSQDLTEGSISKGLLSLAVPIIATNFIQTTYSMVDMIWIGMLGSNAVAAIGTASFFINLAISLFVLISTGSGIKIAQSVGAKKSEEAKTFITNGVIMTFVLALIYSIFIILIRKSIVGFFNLGSYETEKMASIYLVTSMVGIIFMFFNTLFTIILNSFGNSKLPFKINTIGFGMNVILDPILIFGVLGITGLGVFGAALATLISRIIVFIIFLIQSKNYFQIFEDGLKFRLQKAVEVLKLGAPFALQRVLFTLIGITIAKIISSWGATAIAVQKVGLQIEAISYMTIAGLHGAMSAFVGQNYGAKKPQRIKSGYRIALLMSGTFGLLTTTLFIVFAREIFSVFLREPESLTMGTNYLRIIGLSQMFMCIEIISNASFSGVGKTYIPSIVSITFTSLRIPIAIFLSGITWLGLNGVWLTISLSSMFKGTILMTLFLVYLKIKINKELENKEEII